MQREIIAAQVFIWIQGKNAEKIGENGTLWAVSSMSPCVNGLLRGQIRKKNGKNSINMTLVFI